MILRELLAKFGVEYDDQGAKKADADVEGLKAGLGDLLGILGGAALLHGMASFIEGQVEMADAIGDTADKLGIGVEALQELRFAGEDVGVAAEGVDNALQKLIRGSAEAAKGQGDAKDAFKELGVELKDTHGNLVGFDDVLGQVAEGMGRQKTDADRLRLAYKIFGREGTAFAAVMKKGKVGLDEMREKARELGGVLTKENVEAADKADKAMAAFKFTLQGLNNEISRQLIPRFQAIVEGFTGWIRTAREVTKNTSLVEGAVSALGAGIAILVGGERLLKLTKAGLALGLMALAFDEIITTLRGGDTLLARGIDAIWGKGATAEGVQQLREAWRGVADAIHDASTDFEKFVRTMNESSSVFKTLFNAGANAFVQPGMERTTRPGVDAPLVDYRSQGYPLGYAPVDNQDTDYVPRASGRGVDAPLEASGRSATRGVGAAPEQDKRYQKPAYETNLLAPYSWTSPILPTEQPGGAVRRLGLEIPDVRMMTRAKIPRLPVAAAVPAPAPQASAPVTASVPAQGAAAGGALAQVNQQMHLRVDIHGATDAGATARAIEQRFRMMQRRVNDQALRTVRQYGSK